MPPPIDPGCLVRRRKPQTRCPRPPDEPQRGNAVEAIITGSSANRSPVTAALGAMLCLYAPLQGLSAEDAGAYSAAGADSCLRCHDEDSQFPVMGIFDTGHATASDPRTPFAQLQCESCHGPGADHAGRVRRGTERPKMLNFGAAAETPVVAQNAVCLNCHAQEPGPRWHGSVHEVEEVGCADCHRVHLSHDPITRPAEQVEVCASCHRQQWADSLKASSHPLRYQKMTCSSCHAAHTSQAESLLSRPTLNQTCYTCHAEKRGPFLWEHAPVAEECTLCHRAHGSNHPAMLAQRAPLLCQQCHSRAGHPALAQTPGSLAGNNPSAFLLAGSCTNCHSRVHGSNHPSGANLSR